ncbi:MAG: hypothetical protein HY804_02460 [Nitrospinae bacterium]|nr:hypothetical protein [Nitrospinota bacterium]
MTHIGFSDLFLYALFALTAALGVNYYFNLHVPVLDQVQAEIFGETLGDEETPRAYAGYDSGPSAEVKSDCKPPKAFGDAKLTLRAKIKEARAEGDDNAVTDLEQQLAEVEEKARQACLQ